MIKCSFCEAQVPTVGDKEIKAGWGAVDLYTQDIRINMAHCPEHFDELVEVLQRQIATRKDT